MRPISPRVISLALLGFTTPAFSYPGAWLVHADGKYLALDGTMSITDASLPSIAQCQVIGYKDIAWALQCGPEPRQGQPYDPPLVGIDPAENKTRMIATLPDDSSNVMEARVGNWSLFNIPPGWTESEDDPLPFFAMKWSVLGKGDARFWIDKDKFLWAVFAGEEIPGAKTVNLTVYRND